MQNWFYLWSLTLALTLATNLAPCAAADELLVYVGTYTRGTKSEGIYRLKLNLDSGELTPVGATGGVANPSFLAIHPSQRWLYSVAEVSEFTESRSGGVAAFEIEPGSGNLKMLNQRSSGGAGPCHVTVSRDGKHVLVANYGGGSVAALPVEADGKLAAASSFVQHTGSSANARRQEAPHAHSINMGPEGDWVFAADLGIDKVLVYRLRGGKLEPNDPPAASVKPGGGPRHFTFHPSGKFAYTNNEMTSAVTAFSFDGRKGTLTEVQTISTLPEGFDGANNSTAEILVHPSGKFLYCSNRGHDSIAMFAIDQQTGKLTALGQESTGGRTPRNFNVDPSGKYLLAANQSTDNVVVFRVDAESGKLQRTGHEVMIPAPVCVKFLKL